MNEEILRRLEELEEWKRKLESPLTIPLNVDRAFKTRLARSDFDVSSKTQASEAKEVDEQGTDAPYNVQQLADGYLETEIDGTTYYIPYYN